MNLEVYAFEPPSPALAPELALLIDRGVLSRAENDDVFASVEVEHAVARGAVTPSQARTMGQLLGLRAAA